ncbi:hypothetical protein SEVIR_1G203400v4 [Setaria viridis]|uniref:Uncharacterized protein n=1 Tax=Setaria viridis TaxID=4556 RepID=A0A4U6WB21_SETVI|nr:hypothetical protein SEVIR_1G203400v2 [Setaria viridis]
MDKTEQQEQERKARPITASMWPKRLAFKIGKRGLFGSRPGATLLISNCLGVWSLRRDRYVKKTRFFHFCELRTKAGAVEKWHASLRSLGMRSWPEYDEKVAFLRGKLADAYWGAAPAPYRERAAGYLRAARQDRLQRRRAFCTPAALLAGLCLEIAMVSTVVPARIMFWFIVVSVCVLCKPVVDMWRATFDEPDVIVGMLEEVEVV